MPLGLFHYQLLHQLLERVHVLRNEHDLGEVILRGVSSALSAEGGTIFELNRDGTLTPVSSIGVTLDQLRKVPFTTGHGVVGWVVQHGQPVKVDFPGQDTRFLGLSDAATGFRTRNIIAAPITTRGEVVGVVEILNKKEGMFTLPDLELVSMIGREVGIVFENTKLIKKLSDTQALLMAMTDSLTAGILMVDRARHILRVNPSALSLLGATENKEQWENQTIDQKLGKMPEFLRAVESVMAAEKPTPRSEARINVEGKDRVIGFSGTPVRDAHGLRIGSALLFQDITALTRKV